MRFLPAILLIFSVAAQALPPTVADKLFPVYSGTCTQSGEYCAYFAPTDIPVHAVAQYLKSAKRSIRIATYNMDVTEFTDILREKLQQGVRVEFGADFKLSFGSNLVWNSLPQHPNLSRYRLPVFRGSNPQMHNKVIVIDDQVVLFGSANFTYSGLVANYENVLAVRNPVVIAKFNMELDELRANALAACRAFAQPTAACGHGGEQWDPTITTLLTTGKLPQNLVAATPACRKLAEGWGLLDQRNLPKFDLGQCIPNAELRDRLVAFATAVAGSEKYIDGTRTDSSGFKDKAHQGPVPVEVYFSPEDNVQRVILRELSRTLDQPAGAFAMVSTNFITNKFIAQKLVQMHRAGVRLQVFFDRGRIDDGNFRQALEILKEVGIIVFNNALTGPYGCNHNKMAIVGVGGKVTLLNGSANWSASAMNSNDENLVVVRDPSLAAIYTREFLSQMYVYRYAQRADDPQFVDLVKFLSARVPCLDTALTGRTACVNAAGQAWTPRVVSPAILSIDGVPADPRHEQVWVWVQQIEEGAGVKAIPLFTHDVFNGRWLTSAPVPPTWKIQFKFFKVPKGWDPNAQGVPGEAWEYPVSFAPNRQLTVAPLGVHVVEKIYRWGNP